MSLRLDSAETGREYLPRPPLADEAASGSAELSIAEADEAIPEDFWKPVEISACALPSALCSTSFIMSAHADAHQLRLLSELTFASCLRGASGCARGRGW